MEFKKLIFTVEGSVSRITLNRPEKRNALDLDLIGELKTAFQEAEKDPSVRAIVLRGAGKDFCAGMDLSVLKAIQQMGVMENIQDAKLLMDLFILMRRTSKPIVAGVQGRAVAGGCGLATACDLIVAGRSAQFAYTETKIGFVPAIVSVIARRSMTEKRAFELLVRGEPISALEAERIGLINRVVEDHALDEEVVRYAEAFTRLSPSAVALTKSLLYSTDGMSWEQAMRAAVDVNTIARLTPDCKAGVSGFLDKDKKK